MSGRERDRCAVVVPIRSFESGKSRLGRVMADTDRRDLVEEMASIVLRATGAIHTIVATNDADVEAWAAERGYSTFAPTAPGLNQAASESRDFLAAGGVARMILCHADLPGATHLDHLQGEGDEFLIVPDLLRDGSNVISLPTDASFAFSYGPGSFSRHLEEAARSGLTTTVVDDPALAADVDDPADLR